jgi:hypothetical protein
VSATGYLLKLVRLLVVALLFPPRVARAVREHSDANFSTILGHALARARDIRVRAKSSIGIWAATLFFLGVPLSSTIVVAWVIFQKRLIGIPWHGDGDAALGFLAACVICFCSPYLIPVAAFFFAAMFFGMKPLFAAFKSELGALSRAENPEGTVLGRLRRGGDKK